MPTARPWTDEYTLLCERCGYVIEGLSTEGACPECGKPIAESLPERRVGWERYRPGLSGAFRATVGIIRHPIKTLDRMPIDGNAVALGRHLRRTASGTAAAGFFLLAILVQLTAATGSSQPVAGAFIVPVIVWLIVSPTLAILTAVEARGLVFLGRRRSARMDPMIARAICAHGSAGWVLASISLVGGILMVAMGTLVLDAFDLDSFDLAYIGYVSGQELFLWMASWSVIWIGVVIGVGGSCAGFLFFETFAWLGLRRLKYANRRRPGPVGQAASD